MADMRRKRVVEVIQEALESAFAAHHEYEQTLDHVDLNWAEWYADYMAQWLLSTGYGLVDHVPRRGG